MTRVTLGKGRVRESRTPGSVRAKAEWLSYSTTIPASSPIAPKNAAIECRYLANRALAHLEPMSLTKVGSFPIHR